MYKYTHAYTSRIQQREETGGRSEAYIRANITAGKLPVALTLHLYIRKSEKCEREREGDGAGVPGSRPILAARVTVLLLLLLGYKTGRRVQHVLLNAR